VRQFSLLIEDAFRRGISPDTRLGVNMSYLSALEHCRSSEFGVIAHDNISPFTHVAVQFPNPMLFKGRYKTLLLDDGDLIEVVDSGAVSGWTYVYPDVHRCRTRYDLEAITNGTFDADSDWQKGAGWTIAGGEAAHAAGSASDLTQLEADQVSGKELTDGTVYRVRFIVSGATAGTITPKCGSGGAGTSVSNNQAHTQYLTCSGSVDFILSASSTFDGSITTVSVTRVVPNLSTANFPWTFADFGDSFFFANGVDMIFRVPFFNSIGYTTDEAGIAPQTVCNYHDRLIMGGFDTTHSWFATTRWDKVWDEWVRVTLDYTQINKVIGSNVLFWGNENGGDYKYPFIEDLCVFGIPDIDIFDMLVDIILANVRSGRMGFAEMPFKESIRAVKQLGEELIVYGDDGIAKIRDTGNPDRQFVTEKVIDIGISGNRCVTGTKDVHYFLDHEVNLWRYQAGGVPEYIGYGTQMVSDGNYLYALMNYDERERGVYISIPTVSWGITTYVFFEKYGMSTHHHLIKSLFRRGGELVSIATGNTLPNASPVIVSPPFNMGNRAIKVIDTVETTFSNISDLSVAIDYRYDSNDAWTTSVAITVNDEGVSTHVVGGIEFRLRFAGTFTALSRLSVALLRYKKVDNRAIRGISPEPRSL